MRSDFKVVTYSPGSDPGGRSLRAQSTLVLKVTQLTGEEQFSNIAAS